ncbi:hypothetical protein [Macrococcus equipercicus]|nr:hypothetical protein [Macrococcus equipercicus]
MIDRKPAQVYGFLLSPFSRRLLYTGEDYILHFTSFGGTIKKLRLEESL